MSDTPALRLEEENRLASIRKTSFFLGASLIVLIGSLSLWFSYRTGARTFLLRYDQLSGRAVSWTGFLIELARLLFAVVLTSMCLLTGFWERLAEMFGLQGTTADESRPRSYFYGLVRLMPVAARSIRRLLMWSVLITFSGILVYTEGVKSFSVGAKSYAADVVEWGWKSGKIQMEKDLSRELNDSARAYSWYMGYSAMFYGVIVPFLVIIPASTAYGDLSLLWSRLRDLSRHAPGHLSSSKLREFSQLVEDRAIRYLDVAGAIAAFFTFQRLIGDLTLSDGGLKTSMNAMIVCLLSLLVIGVTWLLYFIAWQTFISSRRVANRETETPSGEKKPRRPAARSVDHTRDEAVKTPKDLAVGLLYGRLSGYCILALTLVSVPIDGFIQSLVRVVGAM